MSPLAYVVLGLVLGAALGALALWLGLKRGAANNADRVITRQQLREMLVDLPAAVAIVARDHSVMVCSEFAKACGMVRGTSIGSPAVIDLIAHAQATGRPARGELRLPPGPASPAVELAVLAVPLSNGSVQVVGEDRSDELRFSETRRDFVANVTHELKTPIGAIALLAEAADAAADDPVAVRSFLGKLSAETQRLNELVSQLIALSRLQAENPMLAAQQVDVDEVLADAVDRCREIARAADITITLAPQAGLQVVGDAEQLRVAVTNLVQNAVAYSEPGARVTVSSREADQLVEIRVSDTGIGISEADQQRIFERFYRVDADRSRASGGTGLGLSIVKHVAGAHGGELTVWSKLGQGSTFTLRLPGSQNGARP